jgi:hypothetical protein
MSAFTRAYELQMRALVHDLFATLDGIPEDAFNTWKPAAARDGGHEMNTFAAITIHTLSAAEFMTLHAVGGALSNRNREAEFEATGNRNELQVQYARWLDALHLMLSTFTDADLDNTTYSERYNERGWKTAEVLLHALDHTALHVGHLQVQRQLWETERGEA